jgi:hypothetical protein
MGAIPVNRKPALDVPSIDAAPQSLDEVFTRVREARTMPSYTPATRHAASCALIASLLIIGTTACNQAPTPTTIRSESIISGGIGLTRAEWEQKHTMVVDNESLYYLYDHDDVTEGAYMVHYWHDGPAQPESRIVAISVDARAVLSDADKMDFKDKRILTVEEIRSAFLMLLPSDAQLLDTKRPRYSNEGYTETYMSKQLESAYEPLPGIGLPWTYDPVGSISVTYVDGFNVFSIEAGIAHLLLEPEATSIPTWTPGPPEPLTSPVPTFVAPIPTQATK